MNIRILSIAVVLLAVATGCYLYLHSDERMIKKQLAELTETVNKEASESPGNPINALTAAASFSKFFTDPCLLDMPVYTNRTSFTRKDISDRALMVRNRSALFVVDLDDLDMKRLENGSADLSATLSVQYTMGGDEPFLDVQEIELTMLKEDGTWLISKVATVEMLER